MSFSVEVNSKPCPTCGHVECYFDWDGMTYNLGPMFRRAGFYEEIRRGFDAWVHWQGATVEPTEHNNPVPVADVIDAIRSGLRSMIDEKAEYEKLNPENGWGDYAGALEFTEKLCEVCEAHPDALLTFSG